jgi:beta-phosphoglucomutase-like phosphatase (HAD superfamily)
VRPRFYVSKDEIRAAREQWYQQVEAGETEAQEPYLETARRLDIAPERCIGFEDSDSGVTALKAAEMYAVGVLIGNHNTTKLEHANTVIPTLETLF